MRILVIEDETALLEQIGRRLKDEGYTVDTSADGREGLYFATEYPIDLAIVDLGLPGMPGLDVIERLRAQLGLDQPFPVQYWKFLHGAAQGNFGVSYRQGRPVAQIIAERAGKLYDKLRLFLTDMEQIGVALDKASQNYLGAMNKLSTGRGNVIRQAESFRELGVEIKRPIPESLYPSDLKMQDPELHQRAQFKENN